MRLPQLPLTERIALSIVSLSFFLAICGPVAVGQAAGASNEQQLVDDATQTFQRFLASPGLASWYVAITP
jgi:hypothetical protein